MFLRARQWTGLSLLVAVGVGVWWFVGGKHWAGQETGKEVTSVSGFSLRITNVLSPGSAGLVGHFHVVVRNAPNGPNARTNVWAFRLRNTEGSLEELARSERGIVLRNALIDTGRGAPPLVVPEHLKTKEGQGQSFIV